VIDDEEDGDSSGTEEQEGIIIERRRRKNEYKRLAAKMLKEAIANYLETGRIRPGTGMC
jgi:hypothetical protein